MPRILIIDDEESVCWVFKTFFSTQGHEVKVASTAETGLDMARKDAPDVILIDIRLPGMSGLDALRELKEMLPQTPVIVVTAHGTSDTAIEAIKLGAYEYVTKPMDLEKTEILITRALEKSELSREVVQLRKEMADRYSLQSLVGATPEMQEVFKKIGSVCNSDVTVLITGESGTGKELVARAIHYNGPRANHSFEPVNCGSIPENLLESELYGHERGAFTGAVRQRRGKFEVADRGTVFLDEIAEIPSGSQVKLLRFLEERTFSRVGGNDVLQAEVRVVAATNRNLDEAIESGSFRKDLYYRLNVVNVALPPLRDRREDIPLLIAHFLSISREGTSDISEEALRVLKEYDWPGNVRELRNVIEHSVVMSRGGPIQLADLPEGVVDGSAGTVLQADAGGVERLVREMLDDTELKSGQVFARVELAWERELLRQALDRNRFNQVKTSEYLGIHRTTLRKKMEEYGLVDPHSSR